MRKSTAAKDDNNNNSGNHASSNVNGRQQQSGSYSSIVGSLQSQTGAETRTSRGDNPFKYGKDEMMQVYSSLVSNTDKTSHAPLDFERYEQVTSPVPVQPASLNGLTEDERALLSGNINSEQKPRQQERNDTRSNGRRDNRQNGNGRDQKKHEIHRKHGDDHPRQQDPLHNPSQSRALPESRDSLQPQEAPSETQQEAPIESSSSRQGRNTSRLASMGVFDTGLEPDNKWKNTKDENVHKETMAYGDNGSKEVERLADLYQNQSLGSAPSQQASQQSRGTYGEQSYNPLANGLPDLFPKSSGIQFAQNQQQVPSRAGFMESTPSPGLPLRQDPPMSRVMVMPDKLKWQYRDPTGQNQGPFSGLEMHDWYKAGFFQPNLLVKREEDEDFEPLSILVRRIGNQREPFLVPLPSRVTATVQTARSGSQDGKESWPNGQNWSGGGQPPFPQSFPSFGTTLTAEQQNALERRKQEEQYLMHRQREFLQQQQMAQQMAAQRLLHHQNPYGAHNAPAFGYGMDRRASPFSNGSDRQGSLGSFDAAGSGGGNGNQSGWGGYTPQHQNAHRGAQYSDFGAGIFDTPKSEVADQLSRETEQFIENAHGDFRDTQRQSEQRRVQQSDYAFIMAQKAQESQRQAAASLRSEAEPALESMHSQPGSADYDMDDTLQEARRDETFAAADPVDPAPVPDSTVVETDGTHSEATSGDIPENTASSITSPAAPWAAATSTKGKSLKEIQEIEAKRDALRRQAERRAAQEAQKVLAQSAATRNVPVPVVPLNWVNDTTAAETAQAGIPWKSSTPTPGKKTLAQIQHEEETARKAKAAAQAKALAQNPGVNMAPALGTRYADSAMKTSGGSWSTVGANSKPLPPAVRPDSRVSSSTTSASIAKPRNSLPMMQQASSTARPSDPDAISQEFLNWARSALKDLNPGVNFAEFLQLLLSFGLDGGKDTREIISDSIYANSATLDGRRFADEFCKRRREDQKNINGQNKSISELTSTLSSSSASANGWSDVVKTKPGKQESEEEWSGFKVQAKKGGKRSK